MKTHTMTNGKDVTSLDYINNNMGDMWSVFKKEFLKVFKNYSDLNISRVVFNVNTIYVHMTNDKRIRKDTIARLLKFNKTSSLYYIGVINDNFPLSMGRYVYVIYIARRGSYEGQYLLKKGGIQK